MPHSIKRIRTIALVGQSGSGKTSLAEALLAKAGAIPAGGSVERGTTVGDYTPLEKQQWPGSRRTLGRDPGHRLRDQPASATGESVSCSVVRRVRTAGIANAAIAPSPTTMAPIHRAGVMPSTNVWSVA